MISDLVRTKHPPAIISIFAGHLLQYMIDELIEGKTIEKTRGSVLDLGPEALPHLERHAGDRNRTSPFAFTGNRFEFRAVGSQASVAWPNTVLNTIVSESLDHIATKLEAIVNDGMDRDERDKVIMGVLQDIMKDHSKVVFNGDNYSDEWKEEAARRGLPNLRSTPDALPALSSDKARALFDAYGVLSAAELEARVEVLYESYINVCEIEARTLLMMINTMVMPAAARHQSELAETVASAAVAGVDSVAFKARLDDFVALTSQLHEACIDVKACSSGSTGCEMERSVEIRDQLIPAMERARAACDSLEGLVPSDLWPLPSYTDLLFAGLP